MALTYSNIDGWEYAAGVGKKPRFIYNVASLSKSYTTEQTTPKWSNVGAFGLGPDISTASGPATYGIDSRGTLQTSAPTQSADVHYVIANPSTVAQQSIDCIAVINHNFNDGTWSSISFKTTDGSGGYGTLRTHALSGLGNNNRIWIPKINVSYASAVFNTPGFVPKKTDNANKFVMTLNHATGSAAPSMGEIIWGKSVWLKGGPIIPWDDKWEESDVLSWEAKSGDRVQYVNYTGRKKRTFKYKTSDEEEIAALDELWKHTNNGTTGFLFEAQTNWESDVVKPPLYMAEDAKWAMPISWGSSGRDWTFSFTEQPPFLSNGDV